MYENDLRTGTDYEYNHDLDQILQESYKMPYQPQSLDQSLAILREYQEILTKEKFDTIESIVRGQAIEHMYCDRADIMLLVKRARGELTHEEIMQEIFALIEEEKKNP